MLDPRNEIGRGRTGVCTNQKQVNQRQIGSAKGLRRTGRGACERPSESELTLLVGSVLGSPKILSSPSRGAELRKSLKSISGESVESDEDADDVSGVVVVSVEEGRSRDEVGEDVVVEGADRDRLGAVLGRRREERSPMVEAYPIRREEKREGGWGEEGGGC